MVVDTSVLLCVFFAEKHQEWAASQLEIHRESLKMSTVNLTETLIKVQDRQSYLFQDIYERLLNSSIQFIAPTIHQAQRAAQARLLYPLNLGDCFAYALAWEAECPILTLDSDFKKCELEVVMP